jgi:ribosomal protein L7/L12
MDTKLKQIMDEISKLTITEINELIKALEPIFSPKDKEQQDK